MTNDGELQEPGTDGDLDKVDLEVVVDRIVEVEGEDVDGDGLVDIVTETTTTVVDIDGDGTPDVVEQIVTSAYDLDGDGEVDVIESTRFVGADVDGDGEFSPDELEVETVTAVRADLADELDAAGD